MTKPSPSDLAQPKQLSDEQKAAFALMPEESWRLFWNFLQHVPVSGDHIDHAYAARALCKKLGMNKQAEPTEAVGPTE